MGDSIKWFPTFGPKHMHGWDGYNIDGISVHIEFHTPPGGVTQEALESFFTKMSNARKALTEGQEWKPIYLEDLTGQEEQ